MVKNFPDIKPKPVLADIMTNLIRRASAEMAAEENKDDPREEEGTPLQHYNFSAFFKDKKKIISGYNLKELKDRAVAKFELPADKIHLSLISNGKSYPVADQADFRATLKTIGENAAA